MSNPNALAATVDSLTSVDATVSEAVENIHLFFRKLHEARIRAMPSVIEAFTARSLSLSVEDGHWSASFKVKETGIWLWRKKELQLVFEYAKLFTTKQIVVCSATLDFKLFSRSEPHVWVYERDPRLVLQIYRSLPALLGELYTFGNIEDALQRLHLHGSIDSE